MKPRHTLRRIPLLALASLAFFSVAHAAVPDTKGVDTLGTFLLTGIYFIDRYLVPLVFALAFIVFVIGIYRYFIAGAANEEKRQEGQKFVVYGLIGFVLMLSVWGLVNLLLNTFGFDNNTRPNLPLFGAPIDYGPGASSPSFPDSSEQDQSAPDTAAPNPYDYQSQI